MALKIIQYIQFAVVINRICIYTNVEFMLYMNIVHDFYNLIKYTFLILLNHKS